MKRCLFMSSCFAFQGFFAVHEMLRKRINTKEFLFLKDPVDTLKHLGLYWDYNIYYMHFYGSV